ncbi:hypothetical protein, partial [Litorimonas sp.]|uniref:hypothetical protein n=1 Tax=Litorimonas sp. TaxID=1892381 RepID=UPI003A8932CA
MMEKNEKKKSPMKWSTVDKTILIRLLHNEDGGKLGKLIEDGLKTNTQKHEMWVTVARMYSDRIGRTVDSGTVRKLYTRIKANQKTSYDKLEVQYKKACSQTGGGPGPNALPDLDPDKEEEEWEFWRRSDFGFHFAACSDNNSR